MELYRKSALFRLTVLLLTFLISSFHAWGDKSKDNREKILVISSYSPTKENGNQLINDILDLSKIEAGQLDFNYSNVEVSAIFRGLEQIYRNRVKEGVALICEMPPDTCLIYSEKNRLTQVLSNFLSNACKFTSKGSIRMGYKYIEDGLYFFVADTGKGIAPENIPNVFGRFAKFDVFVQGTGLGLSISQSIVQNMDGQIGVESELGIGTRFWFTLPCSPHQLKQAEETEKVRTSIFSNSN